jgi:hypothetical protein
VFSPRLSRILITTVLLSTTLVAADDMKRGIGVGATRSEAIQAHGQPTGRSKFGNIEVLHYGVGQIRLEDGRVQRINLRRPEIPAILPAPATNDGANATDSSGMAKLDKSALANVWITSLKHAGDDATRRDSPILALFTSSDASPRTRQFQKEITLHPEFVNAFRADYVMLHVDLPVRADMAAELRRQNEELRETLGVQSLPALLILSSAGEKIAAVDIADSVPGSAFRARFIAAVSAAYQLPPPVLHRPEPAVPAPPTAPAEISLHQFPAPPEQVTLGLATARWLVSAALVVGTVLAAVMLLVLWVVLRKINKPVALNRRSSMAWRIDHAASGLPSFAEIAAWPKDMLCKVTIRLAETEGFVAEEQPFGSDKDLVLKRPGNPAPEIIVCCVTGNAGVIPMRKMREMVGMLVAEDVQAGWFIAPMGFSIEARAYAEQNNIRHIDGAGLLEQLSNLPTFALPKVLAAVQ